ncbi:MAG: aspartyl/glutamyl-tRNA amidotransferase subunit C [Oscillospiraceae bacterium]|nr:aspartyl/glutamyl-tRNA amidotransferase subunit C [Oscillospiraceae bacterium]
MDVNTVKELAALSFLNFTQEESEKAAADLSAEVEELKIVKDLVLEYAPLKDNRGAYLKDLREDIPAPSMPVERLLQNAVNSENSFVVPKVVE